MINLQLPAKVSREVRDSINDAIGPLLAENSSLRQLVHNQSQRILELEYHVAQIETSKPPSKKLRPLAPRPQADMQPEAGAPRRTEVDSSTPATDITSNSRTSTTCDSDFGTKGTESLYPLALAPSKSVPMLQKFEFNISIYQMWIEYDEGRAGFPPFRILEKKHGASWRHKSLKGQWSKRCHLFSFVDHMVSKFPDEKERSLKGRLIAKYLDAIRLAKKGNRTTVSSGSFIDNVIKVLNKNRDKTFAFSDDKINMICEKKWESVNDIIFSLSTT